MINIKHFENNGIIDTSEGILGSKLIFNTKEKFLDAIISKYKLSEEDKDNFIVKEVHVMLLDEQSVVSNHFIHNYSFHVQETPVVSVCGDFVLTMSELYWLAV